MLPEGTRRNYEVSIWTLQDSFITVLKPANLEFKGQIQSPELTIKDDGTLNFSFSIPMYLYEGNERKENPIWYTTQNGIILADLRKLKVIFNKRAHDEAIFEFMITKVTESHDKGQLICQVESEGLAFHELGHKGTRIALSAQDYYNDYNEWWDKGQDPAKEPVNNIEYWCKKVFDGTDWIFSVYTDWAAYDGLILVHTTDVPEDSLIGFAVIEGTDLAVVALASGLQPVSFEQLTEDERAAVTAWRTEKKYRLNTKIYEDAHVSSWELNQEADTLIPRETANAQEKYRLVDVSNSNFYNITQTIAETFGVHCKYKYHYDNDYRIIKKEVIFYNNFIVEQNGPIDITYPYETDKISRAMDGTDICTKLYVTSVDDESAPAGKISIMSAEANKTREDYILNFDYLHKIGTITEEQYAAVGEFEVEVRKLNDQIDPLAEEILQLQQDLVIQEATYTLMQESTIKDQEQMTNSQQLLQAITNGENEIILTKGNACSGILIEDLEHVGTRKIRLTTPGILYDDQHLITLYDDLKDVPATGDNDFATKQEAHKVTNYGATVQYDDYGNITALVGFPSLNQTSDNALVDALKDKTRVYLLFSYRPKLYNENIYNTFARKLAADTAKRDEADKQRTQMKERLKKAEDRYEALLDTKKKLLNDFSNFMGPALREGSWQPDVYNDYGDKYRGQVGQLTANKFTATDENTPHLSLVWDDTPFDGEITNAVGWGISEGDKYLTLLQVENIQQLAGIATNNGWDDLTCIAEFADGSQKVCIMNSKMFPIWVSTPSEENRIAFVLQDIYYDDCNGQDNTLTHIQLCNRTVELQDDYTLEEQTTVYWQWPTKSTDTWESQTVITSTENYPLRYMRLKIDTSSAKISEDTLKINFGYQHVTGYDENNIPITEWYADETLMMYADYSVLIRDDAYWITPDLLEILKHKVLRGFFYDVTYQVSNADTQIYLDALEVSQTNAWPQVSYDVSITLLKSGLWEDIYRLIGNIVNVNDDELKFENVQGYVSEINMKLDTPWEDNLKIKNYKTKFEDLFSKIVASSNIVQANAAIYDRTVSLFNSDGTIKQNVIQTTLNKVDLDYSFRNGTLTIDDVKGIWGASDDGVVAFTGGGIFTATEQDANGNWLWNTGIVPSGINASLLNAGQIDTNLIRIFAGDNLRFQMNGEGLYAFRANDDGTVNLNQYVVHDSEGLTLMAKAGEVLNGKTLATDVERVKISWDGITIRDNANRAVLSMDQNGNAVFAGTLSADVGNFGTILTNNLITLGAPTIRITALEGREFQEAPDQINRSPNSLSFKITPLLFTLGENNPISIAKVKINNGEEILDTLTLVENLEDISSTQVYLDSNNLTFTLSSDTILLGEYSQTYKIVCQSDSGDSYAEYLTLNVLRAGLQGATGETGATGEAGASGTSSYSAVIISSNGDKFKSTTDWTVMYCNVYQGDEWIDGYDIDYVYYYNTNEGSNIPLGISYGNKKFAYFNDKSSRIPNFSFGQYTIDGQSWSTISSPRIGNKTFTWDSINAYGVSNGQYAVGPMIFIGPDAINAKATFTCVVSQGSD